MNKCSKSILLQSKLSDLISAVDVYDLLDETMMYSKVGESTSSGNVSQQATSVYIEIDVSVPSNIDNAAVESTVERSNFSFTHTNSKIVRLIRPMSPNAHPSCSVSYSNESELMKQIVLIIGP